MAARPLPLLLFLVLLLPTISSAAAIRCHPEDKEVLLRIKKALNNPYLLASWNPANVADCCDWYCLQCDLTTNRVVELTLFRGDVSGHIPDAVADLPHLRTLIFRKLPNLTGEIPPAIAKLKNLTMIRLSWTNLSGPVPDFLSTLPNLNYLDLSFNRLSGSIPPSLANLTNLGALHLDRNRLTGTIPAAFGRFKGSVPWLYLSHNRLSGQIPPEFGDADFQLLDLSRNQLVGDASMLFRDTEKSTFSIDLSRNQLEFDLSGAKFPKGLTNLDISHNRIRGHIPAAVTALKLQLFNASYNRLCGEIPQGGKMQQFDATSYFHNRCLCGPPLAKC